MVLRSVAPNELTDQSRFWSVVRDSPAIIMIGVLVGMVFCLPRECFVGFTAIGIGRWIGDNKECWIGSSGYRFCFQFMRS